MSVLWILRPHKPLYYGQVRRPGYRRWEDAGKPSRSIRVAAVRMADALAKRPYQFKRGRVLMVTHDYYDPVVLMEAAR